MTTAKQQDMTPEIWYLPNGTPIYFYSIAQLEYAQNKAREQYAWERRDWKSGERTIVTTPSGGWRHKPSRVAEERS